MFLRTPYTEGNEPINTNKPARRQPVAIGFQKHSPPEYHPHCHAHIDLRLIRVKDNWYCPECGPSVPSRIIREVEEE